MAGRLSALLAKLKPRTGRRPGSSSRSAATLRIEYAPDSDGRPDPGEVVWAWVAYEDDPLQGKDRPVIVIGRDGDRLAGVALTTKDRTGDPDSIAVGTGSWDPDRRRSYARLDRILRFDPTSVRREGATLDRARFDAVVSELARRHGWTVEPDRRADPGRRGRGR